MPYGLEKRENWTDKDIYIHRTRLFIGFILGGIFGIIFANFLMWKQAQAHETTMSAGVPKSDYYVCVDKCAEEFIK